MIKMKIYSVKDYYNKIHSMNEKEGYEFEEKTFEYLSDNRNFYRRIVEPPFRDKESIDFLKQLYDIEFVPDDWYSVYVEGGRCSIHTLVRDIKYGLSVIDYSRRGYYMSFRHAHEKVWKFLANLPFDALLIARMDMLGGCFEFCGDEEFTILNYPYKEQEIEVIAKEHFYRSDDFYTPVDKNASYRGDTGYGLCIGVDGKYYISAVDIGVNFQYNWEKDVEGIIEYLDGVKGKRYIYKESKGYSYFKFYNMICPSKDCFYPPVYLDDLNLIKNDYRKSEITKEKYKEYIKSLQQGKDYQEYLWLRDELKIINHMLIYPDDTLYRRLGVMVIDKKHDGSYHIYRDVTVKHPRYFEEFGAVVDEHKDVEQERVMLLLKVEELPYKREDFSNVWCGFRITKNTIETFDENQALEVYLKTLKEAYYSGNCTIGKESD